MWGYRVFYLSLTLIGPIEKLGKGFDELFSLSFLFSFFKHAPDVGPTLWQLACGIFVITVRHPTAVMRLVRKNKQIALVQIPSDWQTDTSLNLWNATTPLIRNLFVCDGCRQRFQSVDERHATFFTQSRQKYRLFFTSLALKVECSNILTVKGSVV